MSGRTRGSTVSSALGLGVLLASNVPVALGSEVPHNLVLFVPDGLRAQIVDAATAPTMARLRDEGVHFINSHSLFPTFTTANASAFATGHLLGDTGNFGNTIYTRLPIEGTVTPSLEDGGVLARLALQFQGNYLHEPSIVGAASVQTALIGKLGPVAIFDPAVFRQGPTVVVDDATGDADDGIALSPRWRDAMVRARMEPVSPGRGDNGRSGTFIPNLKQQQYFLEITTRVVLPEFVAAHRPFMLVYWSRDPDGTQHTQGDGGINGPTAMGAIRNADAALSAIEQTLKSLGVYDATNIIVVADHGFSTITKASYTSAHDLPAGFLALDLAAGLTKSEPGLKLFDPDLDNRAVDGANPSLRRGNGLIGRTPELPEVVIAANGGSDLIYLPVPGNAKRVRSLGRRIVELLLTRDYVSGVFVDERRLGRVPGALSMGAIGLLGEASTPTPAIVVSFASRLSSPCPFPKEKAALCATEIADTPYPSGGGMHGSFSRADTWNFMAARGPDFRKGFVDPIPASNADVGMTIASLLALRLEPVGKLTGRVLTESLAGHEDDPLPVVSAEVIASHAAESGQRTLVRAQTAAGHRYYDAGGFSGKTVGLD